MFSWDTKKAITNYEKHGIPFEEGTTVFSDQESIDWEDLSHSVLEKRRKRVGKSITGKILMVIYTIRKLENGKETIRIISARQASQKERKAYSR